MKFLVSTFLFLSLFIISCSSNPCEDVTCVNGACDNGSCLCEEGYKSAQCDELDIVGTFFRSSLDYDPNTSCSQDFIDYNPQLNQEALCDDLGCTYFAYTFNEDMTLVRTVIEYEVSSDGSFIEDFKFIREGTYAKNGNTVIVNTPQETDLELVFEKNELVDYSEFVGGCFSTTIYTKSQ